MRWLVWCLLFLMVVRAILASWGPDWRDRSDISNARELLRSAIDRDPRVVVFGSSHMRSAFQTDEWSKRANVDKDQIVNLSIDSGRLRDARFILRESGALPESVDLVLIEAARWDLNRNRVNPIRRSRNDYQRRTIENWIEYVHTANQGRKVWPSPEESRASIGSSRVIELARARSRSQADPTPLSGTRHSLYSGPARKPPTDTWGKSGL